MSELCPENDRELARRIRDWFESLRRQAPEGDPRRTAQCLTIPEAITCARRGEVSDFPRRPHIAQCAFCQSALAVARRVLAGQPQPDSVAERRATFPISDETHGWTEVMRQRLRQWIAQHPVEEGCLAQFDAQGILHVHWQGLPRDGTVRLSLLWGDTVLPLGSSVVRGGVLIFSRSLPHLGLQDMKVPQTLLRLEWEETEPSALSTASSQRQEAEPNL